MEANEMSAVAAVQAIRSGTLSAEALMRACLARIEEREPIVKAWQYADPQRAISAAREQDKRLTGGVLYGLPFGVKDMIDTVEAPTTYNSLIYLQHQPAKDAACVAVTKAEGGVLLGKTDTVEFAAFGRKAATRNPKRPTHTPGGSSSGSGAAVADFHVPFAFGTQTGGSLIRPASFNGIYALKPSWGSVSAEGAKLLGVSLDTIGWYARSVADVRLVASAFGLTPQGDDALLAPDLSPQSVRVGLCRSPQWSSIEPGGATAFETAAQRLRAAGVNVKEIVLPAPFERMMEAHDVVIVGEGQTAFRHLWLTAGQKMHPDMREKFDPAQAVPPQSLRAAYRIAEQCRAALDALFDDVDVLLTPSAPGEAPEGITSTGSAVFNSIWTLLHVPCLAIPCTKGDTGLPVGIQLVGRERDDARVVAIAEILAPLIDTER